MEFTKSEIVSKLFVLVFLLILNLENWRVLSSLTYEEQQAARYRMNMEMSDRDRENFNNRGDRENSQGRTMDDDRGRERDRDDSSGRGGSNCIDRTRQSTEDFKMRMHLCRRNISISCVIGGSSECFKDREAFKATAIVSKQVTECLIEANTTELKYILFQVKAKYIKNLNQMGSRTLGQGTIETQRGRCLLSYTCVENKYIAEVKINCHAYQYDSSDVPIDPKGSLYKSNWLAPPDYDGPVEFSAMLRVSYDKFFVDVSTARISIPDNHN